MTPKSIVKTNEYHDSVSLMAVASKLSNSPGVHEDVITMSIEAARNAMKRAQIDPTQIRAVWVGSESHPYAVKPTSTVVAEAIGAVPRAKS